MGLDMIISFCALNGQARIKGFYMCLCTRCNVLQCKEYIPCAMISMYISFTFYIGDAQDNRTMRLLRTRSKPSSGNTYSLPSSIGFTLFKFLFDSKRLCIGNRAAYFDKPWVTRAWVGDCVIFSAMESFDKSVTSEFVDGNPSPT